MAQLPQERRDLPAVVGRVIDDVKQELPQWLRERLTGSVTVVEDRAEGRLGETGQIGGALFLDLPPSFPKRPVGHKIPVIRNPRRRGPRPAFQPDPLGRQNVSQRPLDRDEAGRDRHPDAPGSR